MRVPAIDLRKLGATMSTERLRIPVANVPKFDVESQDYFNAIAEAVNSGNHAEAGKLLARWNRRVEWLRCHDCHVAPPCLIRKQGEPVEQWIRRCCESMP